MQSKQNELNNSVKEARLSAAEAQQAQKNAQAAIESDEMNYEAVKKEIQKLIAAAAASKPPAELQRLYLPAQELYPHLQRVRLAQKPGLRRQQTPRRHRLCRPRRHAHLRSRQRLCAGGGLVQRRLRQLCHHLSRQNDRRQRYSTLYGHMRSVATSAGRYVNQGDLIGYVAPPATLPATTSISRCGRAAPRPMRSTPAVIFR